MKDRVKVKDIRSKTQIKDVCKELLKKKMELGRSVCHQRNGLNLFKNLPRDGRRSRGRPATRWQDSIKKTEGKLWTGAAQERIQRKKLGEDFGN